MAKSTQVPCPVPFCERTKPRTYLMCPKCWRSIGRKAQNEFWKVVRADGCTHDDYEAARDKAIGQALDKRN